MAGSDIHDESLNSLDDPLVICVAPNGARRTKTDHRALPVTPSELASDAVACVQAGATVMHLHVRHPDGTHTLDAVTYRAAIKAIEAAVGDKLLIQVTTEAVGIYQPTQQMAMVGELRPRAASVAIRELIPDESAVAQAATFFAWALEHEVALQYIVYSAQEARRMVELVKIGVIPESRPNTLFVLGRYSAGQLSEPVDLLAFLQDWPVGWPWSVCAFGPTEARCMALSVGLGGHVRVGFENNLWRPDGSLAQNNAELVQSVGHLAFHAGRKLADRIQARRIYQCAETRRR